MKYKLLISVATLVLPLICSGSSAINPAIISLLLDNTTNYSTITFTENSTINTLNPDRGFYDANYELEMQRDYNAFMYAKEDGYNLVYAPLSLKLHP